MLARTLKLISGAGVLAISLSSAARSDDGALHNWSGAFIGAQFTASSTNVDSTNLDWGAGNYLNPNSANARGVENRSNFAFDFTETGGGLKGGYNFQTGSIVFGLVGDFNWLGGDGSARLTSPYVAGGRIYELSYATSSDWMATLRARLGFAANNILLYGTAGLALTDMTFSWTFADDFPGTASGETSKVIARPIFGLGAEYAFTRNLSLNAEYLYQSSLGSLSAAGVLSAPGGFNNDMTGSAQLGDTHTLNVGLNYKY